MADNEVRNGLNEYLIDNVGVPTWQTGLAQAINDTYSFNSNSLFYGVIPAYMRDYCYRYVRPACQWLDGWVYTLHNEGISGIIETRIGGSLISGIAKQLVGEKLIFKVNDIEKQDHSTLRFVSKWADEQNIIKAVFDGIGWACAIGTSLIKINKKLSGELWWSAHRFDQCYYMSNFCGEVQDATFLIRGYTDTREGHSNEQYFLCEHRFYKEYPQGEIMKKADGTYITIHEKGEREPMVEFRVHRVKGTMLNSASMPSIKESNSVNWQELPQNIRDIIKQDNSVIRLNEPSALPFCDLGVQTLCNGYQDLGVPNGNQLGESLLIKVQNDLITYEVACSYKIRDMYLAKGTVYQPKSMSLGDINPMADYQGGVLSNIGDGKIELLKGVSPEEQKIIVEQFEIRADQWQKIQDDALRNIATKWGMSPKVLSSYLSNGIAQMTATQVDSEDDISIAFIYHTRSYFKNALNKLIETTLNYYGKPTNVSLEFASPSLVNKDRLLDRTIKMLDAGLIDIEEAIRTLNPDLDEDLLERKIAIAKNERDKIKQEQFNEMNFDGTFGLGDNDTTETPFEEKQLKGSSIN